LGAGERFRFGRGLRDAPGRSPLCATLQGYLKAETRTRLDAVTEGRVETRPRPKSTVMSMGSCSCVRSESADASTFRFSAGPPQPVIVLVLRMHPLDGQTAHDGMVRRARFDQEFMLRAMAAAGARGQIARPLAVAKPQIRAGFLVAPPQPPRPIIWLYSGHSGKALFAAW